MTGEDLTNKIRVLTLAKDEWYSLHSKIMEKPKLDKLDTVRARRCRVEIVLLDKRMTDLREQYQKQRREQLRQERYKQKNQL